MNVGLPGREYHERQKKKIEVITARPDVAILVACEIDKPNHIFGWIVFEMGETAGLLHYVYVKESFRKFGLCHEMLKVFKRLPREVFIFTHYPPFAATEGIFNRRGIYYDRG